MHDRPRVAYITGRFPEVSLTFILREIEALRALGFEVKTCSLRQTPLSQHPGAAEKAAAATTFVVQKAVLDIPFVLAALFWAFGRPGRCFKALRLAWRTRAPGWRNGLYQILYFLEAILLAHYLVREKVDHLHNHFVFGSATVSMLASDMTGIPFSFTLHGPADLFEPYRWALREKTARASFVATISHYARSQLMYFSNPEDWHKIRIIHCGVTPGKYVGTRSKEETSDVRLLFVGRLDPVKGLRVLLAAMHRLLPEIPTLHLTLVGDGPDRANLEAEAASLGDRVTFTGYLSQDAVAQKMQDSDVFVLPSFAEGVPVVLMEAMASGCPVIATQVAGVGELVEPGIHGLLVAPGDLDALTDAIRTLALDPDRRQALAQAGPAKVAEAFDIQTEAARIGTLFCTPDHPAVRPPPLTQDSDV